VAQIQDQNVWRVQQCNEVISPTACNKRTAPNTHKITANY